MRDLIVGLILAVIAFEIIEHAVLPLIWLILRRRRESAFGVKALHGQIVEIKQWQARKGSVLVNGELWQAISDSPFLIGEKAIVQDADGMTLKIKPVVE